jgi:hypothetical protein
MEGAVRRSQKPGQAATGFVVGLPQRAWVRCDNGHSWQTMTTSDRDRPVEEPQCSRCEQYFTQIHFIEATMAEDVNCTANCWNAEEYQCVCSCGGANHGVGEIAGLQFSIEQLKSQQLQLKSQLDKATPK